jgi:hypothetical protein
MTIVLFPWNLELYKIPGEELEDFQSLSYTLAQIFTFFLELSIVTGVTVRFVQLYKKYRRIEFIKKYRTSRKA